MAEKPETLEDVLRLISDGGFCDMITDTDCASVSGNCCACEADYIRDNWMRLNKHNDSK